MGNELIHLSLGKTFPMQSDFQLSDRHSLLFVPASFGVNQNNIAPNRSELSKKSKESKINNSSNISFKEESLASSNSNRVKVSPKSR